MGNKKKPKTRRLNLAIAPGNWTRLERWMRQVNEDPKRTRTKSNLTDFVNEAVAEWLTPAPPSAPEKTPAPAKKTARRRTPAKNPEPPPGA